MNVVAWIVLGALAGYLVGIGPWGEASTGVERIVLGVVGAIVGGYLMLAVQGATRSWRRSTWKRRPVP